MTREDIITAFTMRVDGKTLEEIGLHFGVTREYIRQVLDGNTRGAGRRNMVAKSIYPGLRKWMVSSGTSAYAMLQGTKLFKKPSQLYKCLQGKQKLRIHEIRAILAFTGLTFEEAFGGVDESEVTENDAE